MAGAFPQVFELAGGPCLATWVFWLKAQNPGAMGIGHYVAGTC